MHYRWHWEQHLARSDPEQLQLTVGMSIHRSKHQQNAFRNTLPEGYKYRKIRTIFILCYPLYYAGMTGFGLNNISNIFGNRNPQTMWGNLQGIFSQFHWCDGATASEISNVGVHDILSETENFVKIQFTVTHAGKSMPSTAVTIATTSDKIDKNQCQLNTTFVCPAVKTVNYDTMATGQSIGGISFLTVTWQRRHCQHQSF